MHRNLWPVLLVMAVVVAASLAVVFVGSPGGPAPVSAQDGVERKNCPRGFVWQRLSGICCVQEKLPANARFSYEGYSICDEGYTGIYERRGTPDGNTVPGCPYNSFAYLLKCVTPQEYKKLEAAGKLPGQKAAGGGGGGVWRSASDRLYDGGGGPTNSDLAATGTIIAGAAVLSALGGRIAGGWGIRDPYTAKWMSWYDHKIAEFGPKIQAAEEAVEAALKAKDEAVQRYKNMWEIANRMRQQLERVEQNLDAVKWQGTRLNLAGYARLLAGAALFAAGGYAIIGAVGGTAAGATAATAGWWAQTIVPRLQAWEQAIKAKLAAGWFPVVVTTVGVKVASGINFAFNWVWNPEWAKGSEWRALADAYRETVNAVKPQADAADAAVTKLEQEARDAWDKLREAQRNLGDLQRERDKFAQWREDFPLSQFTPYEGPL